MPVEPPPCAYVMPSPVDGVRDEVAGIGADLSPGTLLAAYRSGLFPMRLDGLSGPIGWWSPQRRGIVLPGTLTISRSLRRSARHFAVTVDTAFADVVAGCADPARDGAWIDGDFAAAYGELHRLGWAHSVEVWSPDGGLAGGLYGVAIGGLFAGESMFHRDTDASKVALMHVMHCLEGDAGRLLDTQWLTPHLGGLGAVAVSRHDYLRLLGHALTLPLPAAFDDGVR